MKPSPRTDTELLAWASAIIQDAQKRNTHGEVRVVLKDGKIQSVKVESCHLPPKGE